MRRENTTAISRVLIFLIFINAERELSHDEDN